jgi:hypothetical protein
MPPPALAGVDIAVMNLLCAEDLRGAENLDIADALKMLDAYADQVQRETDRHLYRYYQHPEQFEHSEAYFRLLMMTTVLQQDFGVRYNPARASPGTFEPNDVFFANSHDVFLHGLTSQPAMGTCASLPVLHVAVGRRLGYPLYLVTTKGHLFVRWQDSRTTVNAEATSQGLTTYDDHHYRNWPFTISDEEVLANGYLKSMAPSEELACFLSTRGMCLMSMGNLDGSLDAHRQAARLAPHILAYQRILAMATQDVASRRSRVFIPPDPILQTMGGPADWAGRRAEIESRRRRGEGIGPPDPQPAMGWQPPRPTPPPSGLPTAPGRR